MRTNLRTAAVVAMASLIVLGTPLMGAAETAKAPGDQRRWALEFRTRLEQLGGEQPIEIALSGEWVSTIIAMRAGEYDAALQVANLHLAGKGIGSGPAETVEQAQKRLSRPFWATYSDDGELLAIHFFKDVSPSDRNLLQMIATQTQLVRPDPDRLAWTVLERDGAGSYLAIYHRPDLNAVVKRKLKYVRTDGVAGAPVDGIHVAVAQSELRFSLDRDGEAVALAGSERLRLGVPLGDAGELVAITETQLANLRKGRAPELIGSLARALPDVVSLPIVTHKADPEEARAQHDNRLLEGRTIESLLQAAMAKEGDQALSARLAALFRRRPEAGPAAITLLRKNGSQKRITNALGSAGTPAAIKALGTLARDPAMLTPVRIDALAALVLVHHPSREAMRIPAALLDDSNARIASAARITSGALARAGRAEHLAEADALDEALIARYRKTHEPRELSDLLAALGNSVGPSVLPVIREALRDPRVPVRAAAARAMRLAEASDIDRLLSATITDDRDPEVRAAAIFAASFRRPTFPIGEALQQAAKDDPVEYVRCDAVVMLRQNPNAYPGVAETLTWIAEHDSKSGVRRLAREALASALPQPYLVP
jgi:hypothetical protein